MGAFAAVNMTAPASKPATAAAAPTTSMCAVSKSLVRDCVYIHIYIYIHLYAYIYTCANVRQVHRGSVFLFPLSLLHLSSGGSLSVFVNASRLYM